MFLAYIDEVAEPGAFVSKQDRRYNGSPAFGYAGFVIRDDRVRDFSRIFSTSGLKDEKSWSEPDLSALWCGKVWFKVVGGQL